ncbi:MAG: hypothetical protein C0399_00520 [Syntrophus sp. (in: bacteria)]|nr:hypothetical protein [Syntrophus sp. (in: bacteria)]
MQEKITQKKEDNELTFLVPLSEIYKFNETKTTQDLLDAHKGKPKSVSDMHPMKRWIMSSMGLFFLMAGMAGLFRNDPMTIVWFTLGFVIIWFFFVRQEIAKRKAKTSTEEAKEVVLTFNKSNIMIKSRFHEQKREWSELLEYKKTKKGLYLYFVDSVVNWLPADVFDARNEMKDLVDLFQKKLPGE